MMIHVNTCCCCLM